MSVYLPNGYRLAFNCDSVIPESVAKKKAEAYVAKTGKTIYVPGLGQFSPAGGDGGDGGDGGSDAPLKKK